jgi:hypothetical protein
MIKDLLHELMSLVDKNTSTIPEGDYLSICDTVKTLYTQIHIYTPNMFNNLLHEFMHFVDKNSSTIPDGEYLSIYDSVKTLYTKVHTCNEHRLRVIDWDPSDDDVVEMDWEN